MIEFNWDLIEKKQRALQFIRRDIETENVSHAYLFHGPKGVFKLKTAIEMAKMLHCQNSYCKTCKSCMDIENGCHLDTHVFEDDGQIINVESVRNLISTINMTSHSEFKVFILEKIERMNTESANSFLKILEEPPKNTIIILTTENISAILATIISRTRPINFSIFKDKDIVEILDNDSAELEESDKNFIIETSFGRPALALSLSNNNTFLSENREFYKQVEGLFEANLVDRFLFVDLILSEEETIDLKLSLFFEYLSQILRKRMLMDENVDKKKIVNCLSKTHDAGMLIKRNVNKKLLLENLVTEL